jgi:hypothetical protein
MKHAVRKSRLGLAITLAAFGLAGCEPAPAPNPGGGSSGGSNAVQGGAQSTGGGVGSGGASSPSTGGAAGTGGVASSGGTTSSGGVASSGGSSPVSSGGRGGAGTGGSGSGGTSGTGGNASGSGGATGRDAGTTGGTNISSGGSGAGGVVPDAGPRDARGTGGAPGTGGTASTGGATGTGGTTSTGGSASTGTVFSQCRFHFGTGDWVTGTASIKTEIDYFISGWMQGTTFDHQSVCTETNSGGTLSGKLPVQIAYIAANYVKSHHSLCDCNVAGCSGGNLCNYGAQYITQDWAAIVAGYTAYSNGFAGCMGGRPIVFEMEPDWYQYYAGGQTQAWTKPQAGTNMTALVNALKSNSGLKAYFSMDISPWIATNGSDWYPNFNMGLFTFINTSGGGTDAGNTKIRSGNTMTWAGVSQVTGKPILADTGYGAAGAPKGEDAAWNVAANINARMADGVVGICQYSPTTSWGTTIAGIRGSLNQPKFCP